MKLLYPLIAICLLATALNSSTKAQYRTLSQVEQQMSSSEAQYLTSQETISMNLPFSEAVRVGNMLYLSGVIGNVPGKKELVSGGIKAETKQTMENIKRIIERHGSSMNQIIRCKIMLADMKEWGAMNEVYLSYFSSSRLPARSALGASGLALNARVEIECMATIT